MPVEGLKKTVTNDSYKDNQYMNLGCPKYETGMGASHLQVILDPSVFL